MGPEYQYYSVGEWEVVGSCMCSGHADTCAPVPGEEMGLNKVKKFCIKDFKIVLHKASFD